jgi:glucose-6-phosphate isomerase
LTPAWQQLTVHAKKSSNLLLRDLVAQDGRFEEFSRELDGLCVDFSRCLVTAETLEHLQALAIECNLSEQVAAMCAGEISIRLKSALLYIQRCEAPRQKCRVLLSR